VLYFQGGVGGLSVQDDSQYPRLKGSDRQIQALRVVDEGWLFIDEELQFERNALRIALEAQHVADDPQRWIHLGLLSSIQSSTIADKTLMFNPDRLGFNGQRLLFRVERLKVHLLLLCDQFKVSSVLSSIRSVMARCAPLKDRSMLPHCSVSLFAKVQMMKSVCRSMFYNLSFFSLGGQHG
jgi:hypothetical protein